MASTSNFLEVVGTSTTDNVPLVIFLLFGGGVFCGVLDGVEVVALIGTVIEAFSSHLSAELKIVLALLVCEVFDGLIFNTVLLGVGTHGIHGVVHFHSFALAAESSLAILHFALHVGAGEFTNDAFVNRQLRIDDAAVRTVAGNALAELSGVDALLSKLSGGVKIGFSAVGKQGVTLGGTSTPVATTHDVERVTTGFRI